MVTTAPPSSQKASVRPISFVLVDPTAPTPLSQSTTITLAIRPEDLTRTDPSRLTVQQTLASKYMDNFGPGVAGIVINGHTGWHRSQEGTQTPDGIQRWLNFRAQVYDTWHAKQLTAIKAGRDPSQIQLIFADKLDEIVAVVASAVLVLRRNKARPLLCQYQLNMIVLEDNVSVDTGNITTPLLIQNSPVQRQAAALTSSGISIAKLQSLVKSMTSALSSVTSVINSAAAEFTSIATNIYSAVDTAISTASQTVAPLVTAAALTASAGLNLFRSIAALSPTTFEKAFAMEVAAEFSNLKCLFFTNAFSGQLYYQDYSDLYGSSNCSSTNGGSAPSQYAISGANTFMDVVPSAPISPVSMSPAALDSLKIMAANDPVSAPLSVGQMQGYLNSMNAGIVVRA
jgi:hypothetical protein